MLNIAIEAAKKAGKFFKHNLGKVREIHVKNLELAEIKRIMNQLVE